MQVVELEWIIIKTIIYLKMMQPLNYYHLYLEEQITFHFNHLISLNILLELLVKKEG